MTNNNIERAKNELSRFVLKLSLFSIYHPLINLIILYIEKDAIKDTNSATTLEYVNAQIKNICMINRIIYVDKFPRNKLGKCCRRELKDLFTQEAK